MLKFDFSTYNDIIPSLDEKELIKQKLYDEEMNGWLNNNIDLTDIIDTAKYIRNNSNILVVIGIGGSYMGSFAINEIFKKYFKKPDFEIIYAGNNLSGKYLKELLEYLKDKNFMLNVISKSGNTLEINIAYKAILNLMKNMYTDLNKRVFITTDKLNGFLREEVNKNNYKSFIIPSNIGGRYSVLTPVGLLPLSVSGIDIKELVKGSMDGKKYIDEAFKYAKIRNELYKTKKIENFSVYEPNLYYFTEWIKQLFGESEGKNNKGIFPVSTVNTRDLHSLGQFLQEGTNIIFETVLKVINNEDIIVDNNSLNKLNNIVIDSVCMAHYPYTPSNVIIIDEIKPYQIGELIMFFYLSASMSALLFNVNPFDQPGVEAYKKEIKNNIEG